MPAIYRSMFSINDINNANLSSVKAMPLKDSTTDGTNNFAINRFKYFETEPTQHMNNTEINRKKWYGSSTNRQSSAVSEKNKMNQIGVGTFNSTITNPLRATSFTTPYINNRSTVTNALSRVRGGGYITTQKIRNSPSHLNSCPNRKTYSHNLIRSKNSSIIFFDGKYTLK